MKNLSGVPFLCAVALAVACSPANKPAAGSDGATSATAVAIPGASASSVASATPAPAPAKPAKVGTLKVTDDSWALTVPMGKGLPDYTIKVSGKQVPFQEGFSGVEEFDALEIHRDGKPWQKLTPVDCKCAMPLMGTASAFGGSLCSGGVDTGDFSDLRVMDFNFDGHPDLSFSLGTAGDYERFQHWLFDAATGKFVHSAELDALMDVRADAAGKVVCAKVFEPQQVTRNYAWKDGKLEVVRKISSPMGGAPEGKKGPAEDSYWITVEELKDGKFVTVRDGWVTPSKGEVGNPWCACEKCKACELKE